MAGMPDTDPPKDDRIAPEEWISQSAAAELRGISRQAVADLVRRGRLRTTTIGDRVLVYKADILSFTPRQAGRPKKDKGGEH